jgi:hypothetical protein
MEGTGSKRRSKRSFAGMTQIRFDGRRLKAFLSVRCTGLPCSSAIIDSMLWSVVVVLAVLLLLLLQVLVHQRRRRLRRELLAQGRRVRGRVIADDPGARAGRLLVAYRLENGEERRALKTPQRRGDAWMAGEPVVVVYDPRRPTDAERLVVGFGRTKTTWFTARPIRTR